MKHRSSPLLCFLIVARSFDRKPKGNQRSKEGAFILYLSTNVYDEALNRIRFLFDTHDDIIISMSGGKDSTVLFNLAMIVAREKNRLPLKVFWLDQEAEWQATVDYMTEIMHREDVKPYWFQIPFDFTNSLSPVCNFLRVWDEAKESLWVHPKDPVSIKENPSSKNRFHDLVNTLPEYCTDSDNCAVLVGMRITESLNRRACIAYGRVVYKAVTWCKKKKGKHQVFWPIYDFTNDDIWTAIARNHWDYNKIYDYQYQAGVSKQSMRVSALIHETAWHSIEFLQEFEPKTYDRFVRRISGVSTFAHAFDTGDVMPKQLPFAFASWKEYRDYLLDKITQDQYKDLFRMRWKGQEGDDWYKVHIKEILVNDIDGTINGNARSKFRISTRRENGYYRNRDRAEFEALKGEVQ